MIRVDQGNAKEGTQSYMRIAIISDIHGNLVALESG